MPQLSYASHAKINFQKIFITFGDFTRFRHMKNTPQKMFLPEKTKITLISKNFLLINILIVREY